MDNAARDIPKPFVGSENFFTDHVNGWGARNEELWQRSLVGVPRLSLAIIVLKQLSALYFGALTFLDSHHPRHILVGILTSLSNACQ